MLPSPMADPVAPGSRHRRKEPGQPYHAWCCSFGAGPRSPDDRGGTSSLPRRRRPPPYKPQKLPYTSPFHSSPSPSSKVGLGLIDPRRILSPGRVSPIDSDAALGPPPESRSFPAAAAEFETDSADPIPKGEKAPVTRRLPSSSSAAEVSGSRATPMDLRLILKGKDGKCLVLEMDSRVPCESSALLAAMVLDARRKASDVSVGCVKIDVAGVEDLPAFKETIELMHKEDAARWLSKAGVQRSIDVLEVSSTIMFNRGVVSCLNYLEAVPWSESEEEKLKILFSRHSFDEPIAQDVLGRLYPQHTNPNNQGLALRLIHSVANGMNNNARKALQTLVNGLLSKSSLYKKDPAGLDKEGLYGVCDSCLNSLAELLTESLKTSSADCTLTLRLRRPAMIEQVSRHVDNLNWLLEILMDKQMAEDIVGVWANQTELVQLHDRASPMVRYELSRISAWIFIALGRGNLRCPGSIRYAVLRAWFRPMLLDFGWLQRCAKGLDVRMLEESLGQLILTLTLRQQQALFVEWFRCFSEQGSECPNLSKAFQVWWRRSFVRTSGACG